MNPLRRLAGDEGGATIVEYALMLAMFSLLTLGGLAALSSAANATYNQQNTATASYQLNP